MRIALAGNPNSGKTTMFNALTGGNEKVGNWAGVTVDKKERRVKRRYGKEQELTAIDLPGAYSMSPFTSEESITSSYVKNEKPDAIINIVDATNLSRSLFFTTQLLELGIPVVVALNKTDINKKKQTAIHVEKLSKKLGCPVLETVSTSKSGLDQLIDAAKASIGKEQHAPYTQTNRTITSKEEAITADKERYDFVNSIVAEVEVRKVFTKEKNAQDKMDAILTNKWAGIPLFAVVMFAVFWISQAGPGVWIAEGIDLPNGTHLWGLVNAIEWFGACVSVWLQNAHPLLSSVIVDGLIGGVGAVVGFLPLVMVMYFLIALLEDCGYMARATIVLDPIFKKVGLSGKSIIPFIIGTGCAVPGVMACRTIHSEKERRAAAILAPFMPCGAKLPVIALFAGVFFGSSRWVGVTMYFAAILIILLAALLINLLTGCKIRRAFFIMELPEYKAPSFPRALTTMCQRGWSYIVKAGTIILVCNFAIHILLSFSPSLQFLDYEGIKEQHISAIEEDFSSVANGEDEDGNPIYTDGNGESYDMYSYPAYEEEWNALSEALTHAASDSILAKVSKPFAYLFAPITGTHRWEFAAASLTGFIAKENVVGTLQVCLGTPNQINDDFELISSGNGLKEAFGIGASAALALLVFNLFTPPCFAAIGAMNAEIKSRKWFFAGIALQFGMGYSAGFLVYFFGSLFTGELFRLGRADLWIPLLGWFLVLLFALLLAARVIFIQIQNKKASAKKKEKVLF